MAQRQRHMMIILLNQFWCPTVDSLTTFVFQRCVCFFVLCNRHWFNKAPGPDPTEDRAGGYLSTLHHQLRRWL